MGWTRNKSAIAPQPEEPSLILWLMPGVVALMIGVLLFVLHASKMLGDLQAFDPWVIAASPLVFWFLAFCLRGWFYSDALAALLLTTDDVTTKYRFIHSARLLRPMQVNREQQHEELALYFGTQTQANSTQLIIGDDDQRSCSFSEVLSASDNTGSRWAPGQVHWLEKYAGISGPFSPWVMAAVTSSVVELYQLDCLMLSNDGQQRFITTVTKGKQDE